MYCGGIHLTAADAAECDASATRNSNTLQHTATHCNTLQHTAKCETLFGNGHNRSPPSDNTILFGARFVLAHMYLHTHAHAHTHARTRAHTHTPIDDILFNSILKLCSVHVSFSTHKHMHTHAHMCTHTAPIDDILCGASFVQDGY